MPSLRVAYFGTPDFAVPALRSLLEAGYPVVVVVSQPDRPKGRGQKTTAGPVKALALEHGIPVLQPERLKDEAFLQALASHAPEIGVVAAYGKILPEAVLSTPRLGLVNVHASLLPRWRGASPIHRAVMAGDPETGVSIMRVVKALDAGGVFDVARRPIGPDETSEEVERDLAEMGARLLVRVLEALARGEARETPQDEGLVTYAPLLGKEDGLIRWNVPARDIHNQVRGLHPWPHASTSLRGARVIVHRTRLGATEDDGPALPPAEPGQVLTLAGEEVVVAAGEGCVRLRELQSEGRRAMTAREFAAGARLKPGDRFGR